MEHASFLASVEFASIFFDESRNVRGDWEYDTDPAKRTKSGVSAKIGIYEDLEIHGIQTPLWVSELDGRRQFQVFEKTGKWYRYICIRGHRRGRVIAKLVLIHPDRFSIIPCQVFQGLTEREEMELLVDQIQAKGLSDWGLYEAIKKLSLAGLTEEEIGKKIGRSRGFAQAKLRIARMPQCVEDAYKAKAMGEPIVNLTDPALVELAKAHKTDKDNGIRSITGGPEFLAAWGKLTETGIISTPEPKTRTRRELLDMCDVVKDGILVDMLKYAAGDPIDLNGPIHAIGTLREKALALESHLNSLPMAPTVKAVEPTAVEPTAVEPTAVEPTAVEPTAVEPTAVEPTAVEPTAVEPTAVEQATGKSIATVPFESEPTTSKRRNNKRRS